MTAAVAIRAVTAAELVGLAEQATDVFAAALELGPFDSRVLAFPEMLRRHSGRPGFRAFGAFAAARLVGFSEGHPGEAGQWWYDFVAAHVAPDLRERWLADCFEVVELHVHPDHQGRGVGGRLHDLLLEGLPQRTAVLSTRRAETAAMRLYRDRGWEVIADSLRFPGNRSAFRILGLDLPAATTRRR